MEPTEKTEEQLEREAAGDAIREFVAADPSLLDVLQRKFGVIDLGLDNIQARIDVVDIATHLAEIVAETEALVGAIENNASEDAADPAQDEDGQGDEIDLASLDAAQLRSFAEQNGIEVPSHPATGADKLRAAIEAELTKRAEAANAG